MQNTITVPLKTSPKGILFLRPMPPCRLHAFHTVWANKGCFCQFNPLSYRHIHGPPLLQKKVFQLLYSQKKGEDL
jgi:hypothetical protein